LGIRDVGVCIKAGKCGKGLKQRRMQPLSGNQVYRSYGVGMEPPSGQIGADVGSRAGMWGAGVGIGAPLAETGRRGGLEVERDLVQQGISETGRC
jgi:hypothetical protein